MLTRQFLVILIVLTNSIFDTTTVTATEETTTPTVTPADTYVEATEFDANVTYYSDQNGTVADPQPANAEAFAEGTYYIKQ